MKAAISQKDQKIRSFIKDALLSLLTAMLIAGQVTYGFAQTASILPPGYTQLFDNNGNPLSGGKVHTYVPGTTTPKTTWIDGAETTPNANPVILDAAGRAKILGQGSYRWIVEQSNGNQVWDAVTSSSGSGGSGGATGDGDLVGTIKPWAGLIAPNQYAFTYGQEVSRITFSALLTAITQTTIVTCSLGSPILTNVTDTTQIRIGSAIELSCVAPGTTVLSKTALTVTLSANSSLSTGATAVFFPFGNGNGTTTFNVPDLRGVAVAGRNNMGGIAAATLTTAFFNPGGTSDPNALGAPGGSQSRTLAQVNAPSYNLNLATISVPITDPGHVHSINDPSHLHILSPGAATPSGSYTAGGTANGAASGAASTQGAVTGITINTATTGISATLGGTLASGGSGTAFSIVQPTVTLNYIIKVTPDTASSVSTGVTSLGGMVGDIACGSGLLCTGNIIQISGGGIGSPGGPNTSVQFNNAGVFGGSANLLWASPKLSIGAVGTTGQLGIIGTTSGSLTQTVQSVAGTPTVTWGTSSGTPAVTASAPLAITAATGNIVITGAAGQVLAGATPAFTATPILGASGTLGSITFGNATSGLVTLQPVTGALGTVTLSLPAATDTVVGKATTDTFTNKTYDTAGTGNSFLINGLAATTNTGTGAVVRATSATLVTPNIGVATATSINGNIWTAGTGTLTIGAGKIFTASNTITLTAASDGNSFAFPSGSDTIVTLGASQTLTNKTLTAPVINGGAATALTGLAIRSTASAFDLTFVNSEVLTAGRNLTLTVNNASRTISLSGNLTLAAGFTTAGGNAITLTSTGVTNVTLPISGTLAAIDISQTFSGTNVFSALTQFTDIKLSSGHIYPTSDGTTALQITKADGTTRIMNFDTTNARVGINKTAGAFDLDTNGALNVGTTLTFGTLSSTSLASSVSTITGLTVNNSPSASNDYFLYYDSVNNRISKCTVGACSSAATAGVSSLNGLTGGLSIVTSGAANVSAAGVTVSLAVPDYFYPQNCTLAASVSANLLTVAIKDAAGADATATSPCRVPVRSTTATTGTTFYINITSALSISTNSTGASLGSSNNTAFRFWVEVFNSGTDGAPTAAMALYNASTASQCFPLNESLVASTTAISGSATAAGTFYTANGTTLTSKPFKIIGYVEYNSTGLATAGTYASAPNFIQTFGPGIRKPCEVVQKVHLATGAAATGTTVIPFDDTIPQNTEGDQYLSQAITPTSAANQLHITAKLVTALSALSTPTAALFQDSTANALSTSSFTIAGANFITGFQLNYQMISQTISSTTFKVRAGPETGSGATMTLNGQSGTRRMGGVYDTFLDIEEIMG